MSMTSQGKMTSQGRSDKESIIKTLLNIYTGQGSRSSSLSHYISTSFPIPSFKLEATPSRQAIAHSKTHTTNQSHLIAQRISRYLTAPINRTMNSDRASNSSSSYRPAKPMKRIPNIKCCKCGRRLNEASALYSVVCTHCYHTKCRKCMAG